MSTQGLTNKSFGKKNSVTKELFNIIYFILLHHCRPHLHTTPVNMDS